MIRKTLSLMMLLGALLWAPITKAQTQLPLQKEVKSGTLPNGLTYYILHNEEPKNRANFYIAQKVGSTLEEPTQLGLAHFLEHMAFNGTTHYPGKNMLNYLQSKGIRFGADINAYTYYDETVYNINNVPTTDKALMDSVLLCIYDWSGSILLEDAEIDAERGVIESEWRDRNDANFRMLESVLPKIYQEYQYQQSVIGKIDIIRTFPYQEIKNYYKKWYRPDQQGIVIVGDFDADEMENKVKELFSTIPMPENAAPRTYPTVSNNEKPIFAYFEDPETMFPMVRLAFKYDKIPFEYRNTEEAFVNDQLLHEMLEGLINNRLSEYAKKPECKYAYAGVGFSDFWVSKTKGAFMVVVIGKDGNSIQDSFSEAMAIVTRACKTGFTDSELVRTRDEIISQYEKASKESNSTNSDALAKRIYRHFIDNTPNPGAVIEEELVKKYMPLLTVQAINQVATTLLTPENQVVVVAQPKRDGFQVVEESEFVGNLENILNAEYEKYEEAPITDPMISSFRDPGKVTAQKEDAFGTTLITLSNGVKVLVKTTDFKADEILFSAFSSRGKQTYPASEALNLKMAEDAYDSSKLGNYDPTTLNRYLSGKQVKLGFDFGVYVAELSGSSTVKDLNTLMEMIYASFTELSPDNESFASRLSQARTMLQAYGTHPEYIFQKAVTKAQYGNNPMTNDLTLEDLDKVNYESVLNTIKGALGNASDYTFLFVGNITAEDLKPMLEKYIASLPSDVNAATKYEVVTPVHFASGDVKDEWKQPMQAPATFVYNVASGTNIDYNLKNMTMVGLVGNLLQNVFTQTLREEEGGAYSPGAAGFQTISGEWALIYRFQTKQEMQDKMIARANEELQKLLNQGTDAEAFNKVKEAAVKQLENKLRNNNYWRSKLNLYYRGYNELSNAMEILQSISLEDMNSFMKTLYNDKNRIQVIMEGVAEQK